MYMYYFLGFELFKQKDQNKVKVSKLMKRAQNTFLLALDGDVDFHPKAVLLLVDRMRKNTEVGAACGRIHPIGNGNQVSLFDILVNQILICPLLYIQLSVQI